MRAITSLLDGSSTTSTPSSCTSPHLRKNSWLRNENRTSTEVMAKTTSLTLKVVGLGRQRTPWWKSKVVSEKGAKEREAHAHLGQSEPVLREWALRVGDVRGCHVATIGNEDDVGAW